MTDFQPLLVHATLGENSCSQTASGSWCTADPTPGLCHTGSRLPGGPGGFCSGTVWTFCGIDPTADSPYIAKVRT